MSRNQNDLQFHKGNRTQVRFGICFSNRTTYPRFADFTELVGLGNSLNVTTYRQSLCKKC
jgi:hypothetical protein